MSNAAHSLAPEPELTIVPLEPTIGAEIHGVDISKPISDLTRDRIKAAILEYKVVFFRDQNLNNDTHAAFAERFGKLYTHPSPRREDVASIHRISRAEFANYFKDRKKDPTSVEGSYHSDTSWRLVPTWGAVLRAIDIPPVGGDTIWVDAGLAYEKLSDELKQRLEGLFVTHDFRESLSKNGYDYPIVAHPIVRTHRETGKKILWVNYSQYPHIIGLDIAEGQELLRTILAEYQRPEYQVRFKWRPGSVAFWDNRAAVHTAIHDYGDYPRLLHRILIADEVDYAEL